MNAWQRLLAASSLAIGTAWDLITHPKTGGAGTVINNGATISLNNTGISVSVAPGVDLAVSAPTFTVAIADPQITVALAPGLVAQIAQINIGVST